MKRVLVFGTFDLLHPGHLHLLKEAKKQGDELVVVLARDTTVLELKGRAPEYAEEERRRHLIATGIPDDVRFGHHHDKYRIIEEVRPDVICLGYDQSFFTDSLPLELAKRNLPCTIMRLKPYKEDIFKSSKLRRGTSASRA